MMYKFIPAVIFTLLFGAVSAQYGGGRGAGGMGAGMPTGRFYGKIVDSKTNKPIAAVSVELVTAKFNMVTKQRKDTVLNGQLTATNGDFSLDNIPFMGDYRLRITAVGFKPMEQKVSFLTPDQQQKVVQLFMSMNAPKTDSTQKVKPAGNMMDGLKKIFGGDLSQMAGMADKDLGNIKLVIEAQDLQNVTVVGNRNAFTMGIDRKIFDATKAVGTQGQTALEVMKQIPSVNVDVDGNVTLRNATPTLYVDGRPTTLTMDQIPADAIQSVEVITNPSAKFDASGGTASILNIVMKKNRKTGYNGNIRAGIDQRGKFNGGGDFNLRQQKVNIFLSGQYGERKSVATSEVNSTNYATSTTPEIDLHQSINNTTTGHFAFLRGGFDYLMDNRNTLTFAGTIVRGKFDGNQFTNQLNDSLYSPAKLQPLNVTALSEGVFHNNGGTASYKHNFAKTGHELTADVNYNHSYSTNDANTTTQYFNSTGSIALPQPTLQKSTGNTASDLWVVQSDYSNPISKDGKIEAGVRTQIRDFTSNNANFLYSYTLPGYISPSALNSNYKYTDQVFAAYGTYTGKAGNLGYNLGLRAESSNYNGTKLSIKDSSFSVKYPVSLFPSAFLSYKLSESQDLQFNYTRRINRPNFFQLLPFVNYTDPQNLSVGNAGLKPEFTNSFEANYSLTIDNNNSILASVYYKHSTDLITRYQTTTTNPFNDNKGAYLTTYINANSGTSSGLELTSRNNITSHWDITTNLNFYNSKVNSTNLDSGGTDNSRFSFFGKIFTNYRFGKGNSWTLQLNGEFQGKTLLPSSGSSGNGGGRGGGGGGFFMGGGQQSAGANGYINQSYGIDAALKKEFLKNKAASITLSVNDILKTRLRDTYSYTVGEFEQDYRTRRDPQIFRLQFAYRFGKQDVSLFKRKNLKGEMEGLQDANSGQQQ